MTWLTIEALQFSYEGAGLRIKKATDGNYNFNLQLEAGKILAIGGKSGAGKSTLLDLIAGFLRPSAGHIILDGSDITTLPPSRRQVSVLFQNNNLFEHMAVLENVCLGLNPNSAPSLQHQQQAMEMLEHVGLGGFEKRRADSLSGGQMQRTALARELLRGSKLLLLDEPFTGLDEETRNIMLPLLKNAVTKQQRSIIMVTHDVPSVADIIDGAGEVRDGVFHHLT